MQALKSSDFAAVIYFSFAITRITTDPSNFIWPSPTAIFKQYLIIPRTSMYYFIKILKAVLQTHTHHSEGMEYDCLSVLYCTESSAVILWHCIICSTQVTHPFVLSRLYFSSLRNSSYNRLFSKWQLKWLHGSLTSIQKSCLLACFYCFL